MVMMMSLLEHLLYTHVKSSYSLRPVVLPATWEAGSITLPIAWMHQLRISKDT